MKKIKFTLLICILPFVQSCISIRSGHYDTVAPTILDGGWIMTKCTCADKDVINSDLQYGSVLVINGNKIFQNQIARWKKPEWIRYCSSHEEASINPISDNTFYVNTIEERTFSAGDAKCDISMNVPKRIWKVLLVNKSELKFESNSGCGNGPQTCVFKRLDQ